MSTGDSHLELPISLESMAREFHAALNVHAGWMPGEPTADIPAGLPGLRQMLLDEEVGELREAVEAADVVKIADALADIAYVIAGTAVTYGIPLDAVLREVHRSNMTKVNDPGKAKLVKGPGYEPPRIAGLLAVIANGKRAGRRVPVSTGTTQEAPAVIRCKHCAEPIVRCGSLPAHGGCSSAFGWIHDAWWKHPCRNGPGAPYAEPGETTQEAPDVV